MAKSRKPARKPATTATPDPAPRARRDPRPFIYAGFDFGFAILYAVVFTSVIPNRHAWAQVLLYGLPVLAVAMGVAMLVRGAWGWRIAAGCCGLMLGLTVVLLALLLTSAAFLAGVYGAFGLAASMLALVGAALVVELVALLPAFQLKYLMTRAGRRRFGREPLFR
jgi:hypothetical protein